MQCKKIPFIHVEIPFLCIFNSELFPLNENIVLLIFYSLVAERFIRQWILRVVAQQVSNGQEITRGRQFIGQRRG